MRIYCKRSSCYQNKEGVCEEPRECNKDLFHCKKCNYREWMTGPLERDECSNCRSSVWSREEDYRGDTNYISDDKIVMYDPWKDKWFRRSTIPRERRALLQKWRENKSLVEEDEVEETEYEHQSIGESSIVVSVKCPECRSGVMRGRNIDNLSPCTNCDSIW